MLGYYLRIIFFYIVSIIICRLIIIRINDLLECEFNNEDKNIFKIICFLPLINLIFISIVLYTSLNKFFEE